MKLMLGSKLKLILLNTSLKESGVISSFLPRFTGKCDPQSRDLTQLPSGYNFAVKPATNLPILSCWMQT